MFATLMLIGFGVLVWLWFRIGVELLSRVDRLPEARRRR